MCFLPRKIEYCARVADFGAAWRESSRLCIAHVSPGRCRARLSQLLWQLSLGNSRTAACCQRDSAHCFVHCMHMRHLQPLCHLFLSHLAAVPVLRNYMCSQALRIVCKRPCVVWLLIVCPPLTLKLPRSCSYLQFLASHCTKIAF